MSAEESDIALVSDFLYSDVSGGAEANDKVINEEFGVPIVTCDYFNRNFYKFTCRKYIVSNFWLLTEEAKRFLVSSKFVIIEHDYKMYLGRVPSSNATHINREFYEAADCVIFQSHLHLSVAKTGIGKSKCEVFDANLWDDQFLDSSLHKTPKVDAACILHGEGIKDPALSISFCHKNGIEFVVIPTVNRDELLSIISSYRFFIQMPSYPETYSRVSAEAKIVGCEVILNENVGLRSSVYFNSPREDFIKHLKDRKKWLKTILFQ